MVSVALKLAEPIALPVTTPKELIDATDSLLETHVTDAGTTVLVGEPFMYCLFMADACAVPPTVME